MAAGFGWLAAASLVFFYFHSMVLGKFLVPLHSLLLAMCCALAIEPVNYISSYGDGGHVRSNFRLVDRMTLHLI